MQLRITAKNFDIGDALRGHIADRVDSAMEKFLDRTATGSVTLEREGKDIRTDCTLHLQSGITLQTHGLADEAYASADLAVERLEKRLRRHKRRIKSHHGPRSIEMPSVPARDYVVAAPDEKEAEADEVQPLIIAETETTLREMSTGDAVMQMDISDLPVLVFRNAASGAINVVYRRADGHIGWIDPGPQPSETGE